MRAPSLAELGQMMKRLPRAFRHGIWHLRWNPGLPVAGDYEIRDSPVESVISFHEYRGQWRPMHFGALAKSGIAGHHHEHII